MLAHHRLAARVRWRAVVASQLHPVATGLTVKLDPVHRRRATDEQQLVVGEVEQDTVADHVAVVAARHELLGLVRREAGETVDCEMRQHLQGVGTLDQYLGHVM